MPSAPAFICSVGRDTTSNVPLVYFSHLLQKNIKACIATAARPFSIRIPSAASHLIRRKKNSVSVLRQYNEPRHAFSDEKEILLACSLLTYRSRGTNLVRLEVLEKTGPNMSRKCSISVAASTVLQVYMFITKQRYSIGSHYSVQRYRRYVAACGTVCCEVQTYWSQRLNSTSEINQ
jgi:hypothetical protein